MKSTIITILTITFFGLTSLSSHVHAQNSRRPINKAVVKKNKKVARATVKYSTSRRKVVAVRTLPNRVTIHHKGSKYYYSSGRFYMYSAGRYINIIPKNGFRIRTLPVGYIRISHLSRNYYWHHGVFYTKVDSEYEVVEPDMGTVIYELPKDYERVEIDGSTYYEFANVLYEKIQVGGTRAYEVVGFVEE